MIVEGRIGGTRGARKPPAIASIRLLASDGDFFELVQRLEMGIGKEAPRATAAAPVPILTGSAAPVALAGFHDGRFITERAGHRQPRPLSILFFLAQINTAFPVLLLYLMPLKSLVDFLLASFQASVLVSPLGS